MLTWATWLAGLALGGSQLDWGFTSGERPAFHLSGTLGRPGWDRDLLGHIVSVDHLAFYSPARMIREGREADIYNHGELFAYQQSLFPPGVWNEFEAYRNPPFYALLYLPTAGLPYHVSAWIWNAIAVVCLFVGIRWLGAERPWVAAGWALTFVPVISAVTFGQNSLLTFAVFCATYRLLAAGRPFAAGLAAGLLWFKPPLLLGLILWGLFDLKRLWPAAVGVLVTGAALTLGTYPFVPGAWREFVGTLTSNVGFANFDWWKMHNPRSFWRLLLPGTGPLPTVLWLASAAAGVWLFYRVWRRQRDNLPAMFGAAVLLMLWASPHTMLYEWTAAVVPAVLWWTHFPQLRPRWLVLFAVAWVALFIGTEWGHLQAVLEPAKFGWSEPVIFQISVPMLAWVGWRAARLLTAAPGLADGQSVVVPNEGVGSRGRPADPPPGPAGSAP